MVLREAARGLLPPAIAARRKLGQANPFRLWDAAGMLDLAATLLGPATHARGLFQPRAVGRLLARLRRGAGRPFDRNRLHLLVLVEVWHRVYLDPARLAPPDALAGLAGLQAPAPGPGSGGSGDSGGGGGGPW
jgi:Asparagine synthase